MLIYRPLLKIFVHMQIPIILYACVKLYIRVISIVISCAVHRLMEEGNLDMVLIQCISQLLLINNVRVDFFLVCLFNFLVQSVRVIGKVILT